MYIVTELQINQDETASNITTTYTNLNQAQSAYYSVLAAAAISSVYKHAAFLFTEDGYIAHDCFMHVPNPPEETAQE